MEKKKIIELLSGVRRKRVSVSRAFEKLRHLPYEDLGFARVDHHRLMRTGMPEVVFCRGKTLDQITVIFRSLRRRNRTVLLTRADKKIFGRIRRIDGKAVFNAQAGLVYLEDKTLAKEGKVSVVCAGTSDIPAAEEAAVTAELFGCRVERLYDVGVAGMHRLLDCFEKIADSRCIIVLAGMDGVLPSVIGGLSSCPVIAVPTSVGYGANFSGIAPLLTMLNSCAPGVSVVNINNGFGAGYIAALINRTPGHQDTRTQEYQKRLKKTAVLKPVLVRLKGTEGYQPVVGRADDTAGIKSGSVILSPGKSVGEHVTSAKEEVIVILEGKARVICAGKRPFAASRGSVVYIPPETRHDVINSGTGPLHYVYVVSKTGAREL
jgi:NCAIR mutase (PurE)-related protein/mannose-6-phosphate isomerase-like protein (cupin superfamily)